jgi:dimethylhistidine N-methyltransferase
MNTSASDAIRFYDYEPSSGDFLGEVLAGLARKPAVIPPKFFYDAEGSRLFDAICETPEYYPTRTEMRILRDNADAIAARIGPECLLVEPGSGSSEKVRLLLHALRPQAYVPMDISRDHLLAAARRVAAEHPWLDVHAACIDFTAPLTLPYRPAGVPAVAFFPGSSIGNFEPAAAVDFLRNLRDMVGKGGGLLIGVDLKKAPALLEAAYNDAAGVTAAFNRNLLTRINRELGGDFIPEQFSHRAFYNPMRGRVEMHLVSRCEQVVSLAGQHFCFAAGDSIHTESSYKYELAEFQTLARSAGFTPDGVWTDSEGLFSVHFLGAD